MSDEKLIDALCDFHPFYRDEAILVAARMVEAGMEYGTDWWFEPGPGDS